MFLITIEIQREELMSSVGLRYTRSVSRRGLPSNLTEHFEANSEYFNFLLNKDFNNKQVPLTSSDKEKIKEAYNKAHHIREYEINLFWSRLNYLWVINAVLFTAWGVVVYAMLNAKEVSGLQYMCLFLLSSLGCTFTFLASSIARAGKYWQQVWEQHVYVLEPFVSGNLYKMPFTQELPKPSISKSIMVFFVFSMIIWVISAVLAAVLPNLHSKFMLLFELITLIILVSIFYSVDKSIKTPSVNDIRLNIK